MATTPTTPETDRRVIFHADDFGSSSAVNAGILQGFRQGLLTSTSVLSNAPHAAAALEQWRGLDDDRRSGSLPSADRRRQLDDPDRPFDLGIHLNLTQGRPMLADRYPAELLDAHGRMPGIFGLFSRLRFGGRRFAAAIEAELACQIQFLLDHGQQPAHLNGHQYVEMLPAVARIVPSLLEKFHISAVRVAVEQCWLSGALWSDVGPAKWLVAGVQTLFARRFRARMARLNVRYPDAFFGTMTAGLTDMHKLRTFLAAAWPRRPARQQLAEIALHPAQPAADDADQRADGWDDPLSRRRPKELELLLSDGLFEHLLQQRLRLGRLAG